MNTYSEALDRAKGILGSFTSIGKTCGGISGEAVRKWFLKGRPPRTEYTGETQYAEAIEIATDGEVTRDDLRPNDTSAAA